MHYKNVLFNLLVFLNTYYTSCTIIRLPECKYHGNFSVQYPGTRFTGTTVMTLTSVTYHLCLQKCVVENACGYINFKNTTGDCELVQFHNGATEINADWTAASTQYGSRWRGPLCRSIQPCTGLQVCDDVCNESYTCTDKYSYYQFPDSETEHTTTAVVPIVSSSSSGASANINKATHMLSAAVTDASWIRVDLSTETMIQFLRVYQFTGNPITYIGVNTDIFCSDNPYQFIEDSWVVIECDFVLSGKYIKFVNRFTQVSFNGIRIIVST